MTWDDDAKEYGQQRAVAPCTNSWCDGGCPQSMYGVEYPRRGNSPTAPEECRELCADDTEDGGCCTHYSFRMDGPGEFGYDFGWGSRYRFCDPTSYYACQYHRIDVVKDQFTTPWEYYINNYEEFTSYVFDATCDGHLATATTE